MAFDSRSVKTTDWGVIGCAAALLVFSFVGSYVTASFEASGELAGMGDFDTASGISAWDSYAVLGLLLLFAVGAIAAARVFVGVSLPTIPVGWNLVLAGAAALGTLLLVLRAFTYSESGSVAGGSYDVGPGWSGWLVMLLAVGETAFAVLAFRESGEAVPWQQRSPQRPPAAPPA